MLGGGPASQKPRNVIEQIRGALPRTVTPLSPRYPQLLCVLRHVWRNFSSRSHGVRLWPDEVHLFRSVKQLLTHLRYGENKLNGRMCSSSSSIQNQAGDSEDELRVR